MGLDISVYRRKNFKGINLPQEVINSLKSAEVEYWRKNWNLCNYFQCANCENRVITLPEWKVYKDYVEDLIAKGEFDANEHYVDPETAMDRINKVLTEMEEDSEEEYEYFINAWW